VGSGYIAKGLVRLLENGPDFLVTRVLTRTDRTGRTDFPRPELLTGSVEDLCADSEIVVVSTGDVIYGTAVVDQVLKARLPVVTMDAELQLATGSYFATKGYFTEAEGDQPGCLAALKEDAEQMGFEPLVYGNIKGFLEHDPREADMRYWAEQNGQRFDSTIAMTDGTKVQIEQAFVANAFGAGILQTGLSGVKTDDLNSAAAGLAARARALGTPVSDYILSPAHGGGIFLVCGHSSDARDSLRYYKMGDGPFYTLARNYHLSHFEITKTLRRAIRGDPVLMNNGPHPTISAASVAKRDFSPGDRIEKGTGSFDARGVAVRIREHPDHVPIGLLADAVVTRAIRRGGIITFDQVELPPSLALEIWEKSISGSA
ncbi:MAG TPA: NAD(P)-dependent oxidoreductase, partial [Methanoregula sp.]|nr:NAD(P)-dependent oxidoreductase [Methanoregula sp.]